MKNSFNQHNCSGICFQALRKAKDSPKGLIVSGVFSEQLQQFLSASFMEVLPDRHQDYTCFCK